LITTAATGAGVPELLAALDRHRAAGRQGDSTAARLARAEAHVWAIVADRMRARLHDVDHSTATKAVLDDVAEHRLDPYSAADALLDELRLS
jgi:LAO/AO transport system kinase